MKIQKGNFWRVLPYSSFLNFLKQPLLLPLCCIILSTNNVIKHDISDKIFYLTTYIYR